VADPESDQDGEEGEGDDGRRGRQLHHLAGQT
jgi:hypothetical protein